MTVVNAWCGAVTPTTVRVVAKVSSSATARLAVADNPALSGPMFTDAVTPTAENVVSLTAIGLDPGTPYWWAVEHDSVLDTTFTGQLVTHPPVGSPASFRFAAASCAGLSPEVPGVGAVLASNRLSNHSVHSTIRTLNPRPLFFAHLGDPHYYDLGSDQHGIVGGGSLSNYRRAYDDVLLQTNQHDLYRQVPLVLLWDDHDFGPNDSDGTLPTKGNAQQAFRERLPHYPLAESAAIYHSWPVGDVLFIAADTRSDRSPNDDPDGPAKTMLGASQKAWMQAELASSGARLLVWLLPSQWMGTGTDTWASFQTEQGELVEMLGDLGWLGKMSIVSGDVHSLAIDTGGNSPGGIPVFQFASLDSSFGSPQLHYDTGPSQPGRNQYGTVDLVDDGSQIRVTGSGWAGNSLWRSHTFVVGATAPPPPPPTPAPEPIAVAKIRQRVTWLGCDLVTGRVIAELPDLTAEVSRVLGAYTSTQAKLPIPLSGPAALGPLAFQATEPARTVLVAVVNDIPTWAGIPLPQEGGTEPDLDLGLVSLEGYLEHRFVRDHTWVQEDEASVIAAGLLADAGPIPGVGEGIGLVIDAPPTGTRRDRTYRLSDRKTVYEALQELMAVINGPEWTIDLDWANTDHNIVTKIARVRKRIGTAAAAPTAVFQTTAASMFGSRDASNARYRYKIDKSGGLYANYVQAYSSGEGDDQPTSAPAIDTVALANGAPIWEKHFQPSSSITTIAVLNDHAQAELARRRTGSRTFRIVARFDAPPRYGVDWQIGDDVAYQLVGHRHPPPGVRGQGRAIGFALNTKDSTISPILPEPEDT